jgi:hypothetical protein
MTKAANAHAEPYKHGERKGVMLVVRSEYGDRYRFLVPLVVALMLAEELGHALTTGAALGDDA